MAIKTPNHHDSAQNTLPAFPPLSALQFGLLGLSFPWAHQGPVAPGVPPSLQSCPRMIWGGLGVPGVPSPPILCSKLPAIPWVFPYPAYPPLRPDGGPPAPGSSLSPHPSWGSWRSPPLLSRGAPRPMSPSDLGTTWHLLFPKAVTSHGRSQSRSGWGSAGPREVSGWPQKALAGPWGTREGSGASLWCCERHPEGATLGAQARAAFWQPNSCRVCLGSAQDQSSELQPCFTSLYFLCSYFLVFILLTLKMSLEIIFPQNKLF